MLRDVSGKAAQMAGSLLRSTVCKTPEVCVSYQTNFEIWSLCVWNTEYAGDTRLLESIQKYWTKKVDGLTDSSYSNRLKILAIFSLKKRLLRANMIKY